MARTSDEMHPGSSVVLVSIALVTVLTACGSPDSRGLVSGGGSCANIAIFEGREYTGRNAVRHPSAGVVLGEARVPACNHPNASSPVSDEFVRVATLPGFEPEVAVVDAVMPEVIYVRSDVDPLPAEIDWFFTAPSCARGDIPIALRGTWLGIVGPGGSTELDLVPPYRVMMLVARSSSPRFVDAEINILVPPSLGSPLTHEDVETSLWQGGTLRVRSTCHGERFVAESVESSPP
jgi:hypothetical protein